MSPCSMRTPPSSSELPSGTKEQSPLAPCLLVRKWKTHPLSWGSSPQRPLHQGPSPGHSQCVQGGLHTVSWKLLEDQAAGSRCREGSWGSSVAILWAGRRATCLVDWAHQLHGIPCPSPVERAAHPVRCPAPRVTPVRWGLPLPPPQGMDAKPLIHLSLFQVSYAKIEGGGVWGHADERHSGRRQPACDCRGPPWR